MRKVEIRVIAENGEEKYEYQDGIEHQQDIDIFSFYKEVKDTLPKLEKPFVIRFSAILQKQLKMKYHLMLLQTLLILGVVDQSLLLAEKLILSAFH